jgi:hypothetical protein
MNAQALSAHVLQALAEAQSEGRRVTLDTLAGDLRVRRGDIRRTVTLLHRQGFVDALRMRLTLSGFALGRAFLGEALPPLRRAAEVHAAATAAWLQPLPPQSLAPAAPPAAPLPLARSTSRSTAPPAHTSLGAAASPGGWAFLLDESARPA